MFINKMKMRTASAPCPLVRSKSISFTYSTLAYLIITFNSIFTGFIGDSTLVPLFLLSAGYDEVADVPLLSNINLVTFDFIFLHNCTALVFRI